MVIAASQAFRKAPVDQLHVPEPDMSFYSNFLDWQNSLHVPETAPAPRTPNLDLRSYGKVWNDKEIMSMPNQQVDLKWDREVKQKSKELEQNMSQEQKDLLKNLSDYIAPSKLIEEGKKNNGPAK